MKTVEWVPGRGLGCVRRVWPTRGPQPGAHWCHTLGIRAVHAAPFDILTLANEKE